MNDLMETPGYWKLKEKALDHTLWRTRFARGYRPVVWQTAEWVDVLYSTHGAHTTSSTQWVPGAFSSRVMQLKSQSVTP